MSESTCSYDCSFVPTTIPPYSDISGIGVVISYVATAGIAIAIIIVYYVVSFSPDIDPFAMKDAVQTSTTGINFSPNPIDRLVLGFVPARIRVPQSQFSERSSRIEKAIIKGILTMSDLQTLAGLAILISAFSQLRCGLVAYHWQIIVYLAWFSSLTHLACLTFLRSYLFKHCAKRIWRLLAMSLLAMLLIAALVPTANYLWSEEEDDNGIQTPTYESKSTVSPAAYAVCHWKPEKIKSSEFISMLASMLLIAIGFLSRVLRLYPSLSIKHIGRLREFLKQRVGQSLRRTFEKSRGQDRIRVKLRRFLVHRPYLALIRSLSILFSIWTSMIFEIYWLTVAYAWGMYKLWRTRKVGENNDASMSSWTFGQVIPVLMLVVPIISLVEALTSASISEDHNNNARSSPSGANNPSPTVIIIAPDTEDDDPNRDFYLSNWYRILCLAILSSIGMIGILVVFDPFSSTKFSLVARILNSSIYLTLVMFLVIMVALHLIGIMGLFTWLKRRTLGLLPIRLQVLSNNSRGNSTIKYWLWFSVDMFCLYYLSFTNGFQWWYLASFQLYILGSLFFGRRNIQSAE